MNYFELYPGDYMRDTGGLSLAEHGAYLLLLATYYGTEQPLPPEQGTLHRICRAMTTGERKAVDAVAERYFPIGDDGLRHNARADAEIIKSSQRMADAPAKRLSEAERQRRARERRKALFDQLRAVGITPAYNATTADLQQLVTDNVTSQRDSGVTVTCDNTATRPQTPHASKTNTTPARTETSPSTEAGRACRLMREAGCITSNPSHPDLLAFLAEGGTPEQLADTAREAVESGKAKPFAWAITTARGRLAEGAKPLTNGASHGDHPRSTRSESAVERVERANRKAGFPSR